MALIGNQSVLLKSHARFTNGTSTAGAGYAMSRSAFNRPSMLRSRDMYWPSIISYPAGYVPGLAFILARSSGGLAAHNTLTGTISTTDALLALGIPIDANLSASISVTDAALALIVALEAALSANMTLTDAQLAVILFLETALSANMTLTDAEMSAVVWLTSDINASMTLTNSITTLVNLSADIGGPAELSPEGIADAVWDELIAEHLNVGSTGEALSNAGGAGNPWSSTLAANNTPGTFGAFVQKLLTVAKFLGLK